MGVLLLTDLLCTKAPDLWKLPYISVLRVDFDMGRHIKPDYMAISSLCPSPT